MGTAGCLGNMRATVENILKTLKQSEQMKTEELSQMRGSEEEGLAGEDGGMRWKLLRAKMTTVKKARIR